MKKVFLLLAAFFFLQQVTFCQDTAVLSLKSALQKAKDDTSRLRLHLALASSGSQQEKQLHAEAAIRLADALLKRTEGKAERKPIVMQQIRAYNRLDTLLAESGKMNPDIGLTHSQRLLQLNTEIEDKKGMAEQQWLIAYGKLFKNDTTGYFSNVQLSIATSRQAKDTAGIVFKYKTLSYFYLDAGNFAKALETLQTGLATAREMNYKKGIAYCLLQLADIYRDNNEAA